MQPLHVLHAIQGHLGIDPCVSQFPGELTILKVVEVYRDPAGGVRRELSSVPHSRGPDEIEFPA
jgi:hypothetical protein